MAWFTSQKEANEPEVSPVVKQIKDTITQELAATNAAELVRTITENCFDKCDGEVTCVSQCLEKYMRSWNVVLKTYVGLAQNGQK